MVVCCAAVWGGRLHQCEVRELGAVKWGSVVERERKLSGVAWCGRQHED